MSILFNVRKKGTKRFTSLFARNRKEAIMNHIRIQASRDLMVRDPMLMPGSLEKTRRIARGRR